jgi:hypothetical protein
MPASTAGCCWGCWKRIDDGQIYRCEPLLHSSNFLDAGSYVIACQACWVRHLIEHREIYDGIETEDT